MRMFRKYSLLAYTLTFLAPLPGYTDTARDCLNKLLQQAGDELTVGELRRRCEAVYAPGSTDAVEPSAVQDRLFNEAISANNPWVITPHRPNYFMPLTYTSEVNQAPFEAFGDEQSGLEVKFQFSFKAPVVRNLFHDRAHLFFGYTNQSYWQLYERDDSSPFRDTNHEPELFFVVNNNWSIRDWKNSLLVVGFDHQSNGRPVPLSRSWNRLFAVTTFEKDNWVVSLKPWYRLPEDPKDDPLDADGDDNPDIHHYMGYGEFRLLKKRRSELYNLMVRGNTSTGKGAMELSYSRALPGKARFYVQYFVGYGETLIDYNARTHRIGIGIALSDWL